MYVSEVLRCCGRSCCVNVVVVTVFVVSVINLLKYLLHKLLAAYFASTRVSIKSEILLIVYTFCYFYRPTIKAVFISKICTPRNTGGVICLALLSK